MISSIAQMWPMCNKGNHTVLPATHTPTTPAFTPQPQGVTTLWLLLTVPTHERIARLSRPGWLITYSDKCPAPGIEPGHGHPSQY